jgi:hypothetical protein
MKYRRHEAKEYAKTALKGVWTALPYHFTRDDKLDEAATAASLEHCISELETEGHYCSGNVAEFWAMTNEERMRVPSTELPEEKKQELRADLEATGIVAKAKAPSRKAA